MLDSPLEFIRAKARAGTNGARAPIKALRRSRARYSRPRVAAAIEETVLVVVGCGFAVGLDDADLGERSLDRRTLVDGVEPAREIRVVVPFHALGVVVARPGESRNVCDRIVLAAEIGRLAEPRLQHLIEALYLRRIARHGIVV